MLPIIVKLEPSQDLSHSRLRLSLELMSPLSGWQLLDLAQLLRAWTRRSTRVVLSADAPGEWLDDWCVELEQADVEVEFRWPGRGGRRRRPAGVPGPLF
jgi:hypothetical protein